MSDTATTASAPPTSNELAAIRTELAAKRSMMAAERSLMAWIRTGLSMISFGFTIYKILDALAPDANISAHAARDVGLFLTGLGTLAIVMGSVEFRQRFAGLRRYSEFRVLRPAFVMALLMSLAGMALFFGIITRIL